MAALRSRGRRTLSATCPKDGKFAGAGLLGNDTLKTEDDVVKYMAALLEKKGTASWTQRDATPLAQIPLSEFGYWLNMLDGKVEGLFVMGQNPAVGAPNARLERKALAKLKWLVVRDMVETETASFWYASPEVERGELKPKDVATEVFLMPAAGSAEKDGCYTNTQRLVQRDGAADARRHHL